MKITIAIPTLGRDDVLLDTVNELLRLDKKADEIIIVDQSDNHNNITAHHLNNWHIKGEIRWLRIKYKSITHAMNVALRKATSEKVLFLDDDIIPDKNLIEAHYASAHTRPSTIIAGRVLQPWHKGKEDISEETFLFNSLREREVSSFMGGNVLIPRSEAISIGGFDTNFVRVAYHFEAEFAYRWISRGNHIFYEPKALIHHLKTERGGTRSYGHHLTTVRPDHAVGRHYYYLCRYSANTAIIKSLRDLSRSTLTKHHLRHPLWIPFTLISEICGLVWALILFKSGRGTIKTEKVNLMVVSSHPIQYYSPIFRRLDKSQDFSSTVLYLTLPDPKSQSLGFEQNFSWDIPLLEGYNYRTANSFAGKGLFAGFMGVKVKKPWQEIKQIKLRYRPDAVLLTGWHFWGMVQLFAALKLSNIPIILRMDSNSLRKRNPILRFIYDLFFSWVDISLSVGKLNRDFCINHGMEKSRIISSPHVVDNNFFYTKAVEARHSFEQLRLRWQVPTLSYCFIYAGKLQGKKRPLDLLKAFKLACSLTDKQIHLLVVGSGPLWSRCKEFAMINSLPVSFIGFLNQTAMPEAYAITDCIVLPSDEGETWGLVINEAMACGLPAIVSDTVGCAPDLVMDEVTGFKYKCGDFTQLAEHLVYMAEHKELSREMGSNAQCLINSKYNLKRVVDSIETAMYCLNG
jgi:glycosyltransferase involved in cell wall biosynthesis